MRSCNLIRIWGTVWRKYDGVVLRLKKGGRKASQCSAAGRMTPFHVRLLALVSEQLIHCLKMSEITIFKYDETISDKSLPA